MAKTRKPRTKAPEGETKAQKFERLARHRMTKALNTIRQLGNLSGPGYEFTEDQVSKMNQALAGAIATTMKRFVAKKDQGGSEGFSF